MKTMSNVDINAICYELNDFLKGARVDKSFQPTNDTVIMRFHVSGTGRVDLIFQAGMRIIVLNILLIILKYLLLFQWFLENI